MTPVSCQTVNVYVLVFVFAVVNFTDVLTCIKWNEMKRKKWKNLDEKIYLRCVHESINICGCFAHCIYGRRLWYQHSTFYTRTDFYYCRCWLFGCRSAGGRFHSFSSFRFLSKMVCHWRITDKSEPTRIVSLRRKFYIARSVLVLNSIWLHISIE